MTLLLNDVEVEPLDELRSKWQHLLDVLQAVTGVSATLVMRVHAHDIEVFARSSNPNNVYQERERAQLGTGLYCETVMSTRAQLLVPDARDDPAWAHNPDIELGMVSYLGLPVAWPSGEVFGTICMLDSKYNRYSDVYRSLLEQFRGAVELDLAAVVRENELRRRNAEMDRQQAALARANTELAEFAHVASHDLSEPLRAITWFVNLMLEHLGTDMDDDARRYADFVLDSTARMRMLIDDLLAISRVGHAESVDEEISLDDIVFDTLSLLAPVIAEAGASVQTDQLPRVHASRTMQALLLRNLIGNAMKFHRPGQTPLVHVSAVREGAWWEIRVDDNGIGIDAAHRERVFTMFKRLHAREDYPGTGIGLAICKKIVETSGGHIWVTESPLGGAGLRYTVPASDRDRT